MAKYDNYKDSGIEWIGEIPQSWHKTKIKFLANMTSNSFTDGDWVELPYITEDGIRLIQTGNIGIGSYKEQGFRYIEEDSFEKLNCTEVFPNDVLICRLAAPVGRACLAPNLDKRMITSVDNCILKPSKHNDPRYIVFQLSAKQYLEYVEFISRGGTRSRISRSMLGDIDFIAPPLSEQQSIADFLDDKTAKIDNLISIKQKQIELLKEQWTAVINHAVTKGLDPNAPMKDSGIEWLGEIPKHWEILPLKRIIDKFVDYRGKTPEKTESGIPLITAKNIKNGIIDFYLSQEYISLEDYDDWMVRGMPQTGDVLITTEAPLGEVAQIEDTRIALAQRIIMLKCNKPLCVRISETVLSE